jgi:7,8-dihydroneopterin aldolase/epimerase/oxygenase
MDKIILAGIDVYAYGGATPAEKEIGQRYRAGVELELDLAAATLSDSLADTVNYSRVHAVVVQTLRERPFNLLESVTGRIADRILELFPVARVTVQVQKLLPPIDGAVAYAAVEVSRERKTD